jgi:hypothetical protein
VKENRLFLLIPLSLLFVASGIAQNRVSPANRYERVLAVVPMIGRGTADDPRRPAYAPAPSRGPAATLPSIGFTAQISDDGRYALVEFVVQDRSALKNLLSDKRPDVKVFEKGRARKEDIETEFRRLKTTIDLTKMGVTRP